MPPSVISLQTSVAFFKDTHSCRAIANRGNLTKKFQLQVVTSLKLGEELLNVQGSPIPQDTYVKDTKAPIPQLLEASILHQKSPKISKSPPTEEWITKFHKRSNATHFVPWISAHMSELASDVR